MKIKIIDLTHVLNENIPVYPGTPAPKFEKMAAIEPDGFRETVMHISSHVGTHIDAPAHFLERGATMPEYSLADFQGSAVVVQVDPGCTQITSQMIENTRGVEEADVILFGNRMGPQLDGPKAISYKLPDSDPGSDRSHLNSAPADCRV